MASDSAQWSNLPRDVLSAVANLLDLDPDLRRVRAVCSAWRSNLSHLVSTFPDASFPVEVPSLATVLSYWDEIVGEGQHILNKSTIYCIYPPVGGSGSCKGTGWLFKVSKTLGDRNTYSLLVPLSKEKIKAPIENFPKTLSRLDYRVTEICTSYSHEFRNMGKPQIECLKTIYVRRTIVLQNYILGCDFVVMILTYGGKIHYWRRGDVGWTRLVADKDYWFDDVVLYDGKCYAVNKSGILVLIDSSWRFTEITSCMGYDPSQNNFLVVGLNSELYMVHKISDPDPIYYYEDEDDEYFPTIDPRTINQPFRLRVLKLNKSAHDWDYVNDLGDQVFFLGDDVTFCVSADNFDGCKKNSVYLTDECFYDDSEGSVYGEDTGLYDLATWETVALAIKQEHAKFYWPPPSWLMMEMEAGSSERRM